MARGVGINTVRGASMSSNDDTLLVGLVVEGRGLTVNTVGGATGARRKEVWRIRYTEERDCSVWLRWQRRILGMMKTRMRITILGLGSVDVGLILIIMD